ncbi:prominin-1-like isoform X2 [Pomacea canaliculata]|nr:prominin-1-like isoform X2 [Pomacea canaliculata]
MSKASPMVLWTLLLVLYLCILHTYGQTGNRLENGKIVWGDLEPDDEYKTTGYKADLGGLEPYYNLAKSFIRSSLAENLPIEKLKALLKDFSGPTIKDVLVDSFLGYAVCLAIGILFILIFPIVGLCFCCCRCCGNCGGKRIQEVKPNAKCRRIGFGVALVILSLFVVAGSACAFVSSNQVTNSIGPIKDVLNNSVDDVQTFFGNVNRSFTHIADGNFKFLIDVVDNYTKEASGHVSDQLMKDVSKIVNLQTPLDAIGNLKNEAVVKVDRLSQLTQTLDTQLPQTGGPSPVAGIQTTLSEFKTKVSADVFGDLKKKIDSQISTTIAGTTQRVDVHGKMDPIFENNIKPMLEKIRDMKTTMGDTTKDFSSTMNSYIDTAKPYDKYRWIAGVALASLILLIAVLPLVGVLLGLCGGSEKVKPTERGCASNCGGILLMSAAGLIFIFGPLLMLLTTTMYAVGSPLERYGCEGVHDVKKLESYVPLIDGIGFDPRNVTLNVAGETVTVSASTVLDSCKEGKTLYTVLDLKKVIDKGLEKVTEFKNGSLTKGLSFDSNTVATSLGKATLDATSAVNDLKATVTVVGNLQTQITNLENQVMALGSAAGQMVNIVSDMKSTAAELTKVANDIETEAQQIPTLITTATNTLKDPTVMPQLIDKATKTLQDNIFQFVDSYTTDLKTKMANEVGKCTPLYSIFNAMMMEGLCYGIVDPLNGFWLAIGWSIFFFMPSLILSVKLAKYFRTMLYDDSYDNPIHSASVPPLATKPSSGKKKRPSFPQADG